MEANTNIGTKLAKQISLFTKFLNRIKLKRKKICYSLGWNLTFHISQQSTSQEWTIGSWTSKVIYKTKMCVLALW